MIVGWILLGALLLVGFLAAYDVTMEMITRLETDWRHRKEGR